MIKNIEASLNPFLTPLSIENTPIESFMWPFRNGFRLYSLVKITGMGDESKAFLKLTKTMLVSGFQSMLRYEDPALGKVTKEFQ
ncbi:hypothetical protein ACTXT7_003660 [Hymenolepis weldensis]